MKRTKSMIYKPTEEARELFMYTDNNGDLWRKMGEAYAECLKKKIKKGNYNSDKAVDLLYRLTTAASDQYKREFGYSFSVQDRFTAAVDLEKDLFETLTE